MDIVFERMTTGRHPSYQIYIKTWCFRRGKYSPCDLCCRGHLSPGRWSTFRFIHFPDFFRVKLQILLTFCSMKIWYFDLPRNSHGSHSSMEKIAVILWQKNPSMCMICHFYISYQLDYGLIYKLSKYYRNMVPNVLVFLTCLWLRLSNCIMTVTVKIWNEAFILILTPFSMTLSFFGEFQNFLTNINISWLFPDFLRYSPFRDFFRPVGTRKMPISWRKFQMLFLEWRYIFFY